MNKYLLMAVGWLWSVCAWAGIPIQFWMLDNGAKVYLMEVPGLPMVLIVKSHLHYHQQLYHQVYNHNPDIQDM